MNNINPKNLQVFIGGALAAIAWHGFKFGVHGLAIQDLGLILPGAFACLSLPLGIGLLLERPLALRLAKPYLAVILLTEAAILTAEFTHLGPAGMPTAGWAGISSFIAMVLLFAGLLWSSSGKAKG